LVGVDTLVLRNVTAIDNGDADSGDGISFFEVSEINARNILVAENSENGLSLTQDVYDGTFVNVTVVGNGGGGGRTAGLYFSTDARRNTVRNLQSIDNIGPGIRFSDSDENVIRRAIIEGNAGPGIHGDYAGNERLESVVVRNNSGGTIDLNDGTLSARSLRVGDRARFRFIEEPVSINRIDTDTLPAPPTGDPLAEGINVTGLDRRVILTFEDFDPSEVETGVELWRFDGDVWTPVENVQHDVVGGELTATLREDGIVVPVLTDNEPPDSDGPIGNSSVFEILSTDEDGEFGYAFTVDGTVEKTMTDDVAADRGDRIVRNSDGTATVRGSTGSASGDAFLVTGEISDFRLRYGEPNFVLELDDEDVTEELAGDIVPPEPSTVAIYATTEGEDFTYELVVDGTAEGTMTDEVAADSGDEVIPNDDGTVTIRGSTGDLSGDAFTVRGEILSFSTSAAPGEYRIERDGVDITDRLEPDTPPSTFAIYSTTEDVDFGYEFVVDGTAAKTMTDEVAADAGDRVIRNSDGTVTVRGSTGDLSGDAFTVWGDIRSFRILGEESGYRLELDGVDVTDEYGE
jgi:hypothetical protein